MNSREIKWDLPSVIGFQGQFEWTFHRVCFEKVKGFTQKVALSPSPVVDWAEMGVRPIARLWLFGWKNSSDKDCSSIDSEDLSTLLFFANFINF